MDFGAVLKLRNAWQTFTANHPKFPEFLQAVKSHGPCEGMMIDISVTYPNGENLRSGIKVRESDLELIRMLSSLAKQQ